MSNRKIRVGIDVGGTHTKAVAVDDATYEIVGIGSVQTTHSSELGVSEGVVESFKKCLNDNNISPDEVTFIAHSTTQATNALLEGDVAKTGIVGMGQGIFSGFLSNLQSNVKEISLDNSGKRKIRTAHRYMDLKNFNKETVGKVIDDLKADGCGVIVASKAFGVDDIEEELAVKEVGKEKGIEVTAASDISKLYGLTRRTRTAVINASILPKMFETADSTESAVRKAGIKAPLMIMRGDGGVMDIEEMRKRPVLTMLSGPADAADTCIAVIEELAEKHKVERDQITLVGGGGGATALLPFTAKKMNLPYQIAENAEVISSIGVALAMVRDVVERVIPNPTPQDLAEIRTEATDMAIKSGATAESIEIQIEIDSQTSKVRAIATGSTEIQTQDLAKKVTLAEATEIAAASMRVDASKAKCLVKNDNFFVFGSDKGRKQEVRVVDKKGFVKIQRSDGAAVETTTTGVRSMVDKMWEELSVYKSDIKISPDFYLCIGAKVIDYEGMSGLEQLHMVMDSELMTRSSGDSLLLIGAKNDM